MGNLRLGGTGIIAGIVLATLFVADVSIAQTNPPPCVRRTPPPSPETTPGAPRQSRSPAVQRLIDFEQSLRAHQDQTDKLIVVGEQVREANDATQRYTQQYEAAKTQLASSSSAQNESRQEAIEARRRAAQLRAQWVKALAADPAIVEATERRDASDQTMRELEAELLASVRESAAYMKLQADLSAVRGELAKIVAADAPDPAARREAMARIQYFEASIEQFEAGALGVSDGYIAARNANDEAIAALEQARWQAEARLAKDPRFASLREHANAVQGDLRLARMSAADARRVMAQAMSKAKRADGITRSATTRYDKIRAQLEQLNERIAELRKQIPEADVAKVEARVNQPSTTTVTATTDRGT